MAQIREFRPKIVFDDDEKSNSSGSDQSESDPVAPDPFSVFTRIGLRKLQENDPHCVSIKNLFAVPGVEIVAVHRNLFTGLLRQAAFLVFKESVAEKCSGNANVRCGWYGGSRDLICDTVLHGFFCTREPGPYGVGVHLFSIAHSADW